MTDLIDRQAAIEHLKMRLNESAINNVGVMVNCNKVFEDIADNRIETWLSELPSAEKRGRWEITDAYPHNVHCGVCHKRFAQTHWQVWEDGTLPRNYCPNCGVKMEKSQDE